MFQEYDEEGPCLGGWHGHQHVVAAEDVRDGGHGVRRGDPVVRDLLDGFAQRQFRGVLDGLGHPPQLLQTVLRIRRSRPQLPKQLPEAVAVGEDGGDVVAGVGARPLGAEITELRQLLEMLHLCEMSEFLLLPELAKHDLLHHESLLDPTQQRPVQEPVAALPRSTGGAVAAQPRRLLTHRGFLRGHARGAFVAVMGQGKLDHRRRILPGFGRNVVVLGADDVAVPGSLPEGGVDVRGGQVQFDVEREGLGGFADLAGILAPDVQYRVDVNGVVVDRHPGETPQDLPSGLEAAFLDAVGGPAGVGEVGQHVGGAAASPQATRPGEIPLDLTDPDGCETRHLRSFQFSLLMY